MIFSAAKWIWQDTSPAAPDTYCEFVHTFRADGAGAVTCRLSADSDYVLFVNGRYVASNQYGDFEHYKSYDELDLTPYLTAGENRLAVLVWHWGINLQRYCRAAAGLIFEVATAEGVIAASGSDTLVRLSRAYRSGLCKTLTPQLGYSFAYDATLEDAWLTAPAEGFAPAAVIEKHCSFVPRPIARPVLLPAVVPTLVSNADNRHFVLDLGRETVGLCRIRFTSPAAQELTVSYGEHLIDGHVSRHIGSRDFSFTYRAAAGENDYTNYMLRLGCRYLELEFESPVTLAEATLLPQIYPAAVARRAHLEDPQDQAIYDLCLSSLSLCMMEHYVDCPWREQCLYGFDSRNQMMTGYYAFENGNAAYARSNLLLMGMDRREDDLLSICSPCSSDLTIPSFSLHYVIAVEEYLRYTDDLSLPHAVADKLVSLLSVFLAREQYGLISTFTDRPHWNFYDWSPYSDGGKIRGHETAEQDIVLNALVVLALEAAERIFTRLKRPFPYAGKAETIRLRAREVFFNAERGLFDMKRGEGQFTELANLMAVLSDIADENQRPRIAVALSKGTLIPCALAFKAYKYEALLKCDEARFRPYVLADIRADYGIMLENGATATWETLKGWEDFGNAGSLCHGWSATPIIFYHRFGMVSEV